MKFEHNGRAYNCTIGSDLVRDGMYIEVCEGSGSFEIIGIFYSDITGEMTVSVFIENVPLPVLEWAISVARQRLSPSERMRE